MEFREHFEYECTEAQRELQCPICFLPAFPPANLLPCEHLLCQPCHAKIEAPVSCPSCRSRVSSTGTPHRILLNYVKDVKAICKLCKHVSTVGTSEAHYHVCKGRIVTPPPAATVMTPPAAPVMTPHTAVTVMISPPAAPVMTPPPAAPIVQQLPAPARQLEEEEEWFCNNEECERMVHHSCRFCTECGSWNCARCGRSNFCSRRECRNCGNEREGWMCAYCNAENDDTEKFCEVCESWECDSCDTSNFNSKEFCRKCDRARTF